MTTPTAQIETWIIRRLGEPDLFAGVTTADERRERVRELIERRELHLAIAGRNPSGKPETWQALYERVYGRPIEVPRETKRKLA